MNHAKDAKQEVLTRLLGVARMIRRRGLPDEAEAVLPYERQFEADLRTHEAEVAQLPGLDNRKAVAA